MNFWSFVKGVTFHDRGYGLLDNKPIGGVSSETWLATQRDGILQQSDDAVANIVSVMHIKRLLTNSDRQGRDELIALAEGQIDQSLKDIDVSLDAFEWADKITRWCDNVSFDFCFDEKVFDDSEVYTHVDAPDEITVGFDIDASGVIRVDPWPFSVEHYAGFIVAYQLDGYPQKLEPVLMEFSLVGR